MKREGYNARWANTFSFFVLLKGGLVGTENKWKQNLVERIEKDLPGSMIFHLNPHDYQGAPDLLILYKDKWATLEGKKDSKASHRSNQDYYVDKMNKMSYSRIIYPENEEEVLDELYATLQSGRKTRHARRK